jgi:hypothetical protein
MTITRALPLAALLTAAALVGAGCGSDASSDEPSAADASAAYRSIRTQIVSLGDSIGQEITSARTETDAQLTSAFDDLDARGRAAVARLQGLDVPAELDDELQALRDALDRGTQDLADIASAAQAHDASSASSAVRQLIADSRTIGDARDDFEHALEQARD